MGALVCLALPGALGPASAQANRSLISKEALETKFLPPEGQIEGACGIAIAPNGALYASDYYHSQVGVFSNIGIYQSQFAVNPLDGVCQLAFDSGGNLYANEWHEAVVRLKPSLQVFDTARSTGVAVDAAGNVYANDRTHVSVYASSGALIEEIGTGHLGDAYGLAVSGARVYVPDAAASTVKVFEPSKTAEPVGAIAPPGGFSSLVDASVTVDPTNGHVLVLDNLQPGFEHPMGGIDEFAADGTFINQLNTAVIDAGPSGMAVSNAGELYVTSGNSEKANAFAFGAYTESGPEATEAAGDGPLAQSGAAAPAVGGDLRSPGSQESAEPFSGRAGMPRRHRHRRHPLRARLWAAKVAARG
jgi:hypothetical protein